MKFYQKQILPKLLDFRMQNAELEHYRPEVVAQARGVVLEIGFGSGLNLPYYHHTDMVYALDPSVELYNLAKVRIEQVSFPVEYMHASAENIPLLDNTIDTVVSTWSLCSIPNIEAALREIYRVLKPGGKFVFIEHGKSPKKYIALLQNILTPISKCIAGGCHMNREIDIAIAHAGFTFEKLERFEQKGKTLSYMYKGVALIKK